MTQTPLIAVIGCGLIGQSWTALFRFHGFDVVAWDPDRDACQLLPAQVEPMLAQLREIGGGKNLGALTLAVDLAEAVRAANWVQENAPENVPLKQRLYAEIEAVTSDDTIIASSTSSLTWSELAVGMRHPDRLVTAHPFNPPHLMPLVELYARAPATLEKAVALYKALGRETVTLRKDAVGHIANRLASALWREAVHIVAEGIADVADVDAAMVHGPGLRWSIVGAHMAYHLGGGAGGLQHYLEHLGASQERRWASLGTPSLTPAVRQLLVEGIAREAAGRSIAQLEEERDRGLIRALAARKASDVP